MKHHVVFSAMVKGCVAGRHFSCLSKEGTAAVEFPVHESHSRINRVCPGCCAVRDIEWQMFPVSQRSISLKRLQGIAGHMSIDVPSKILSLPCIDGIKGFSCMNRLGETLNCQVCNPCCGAALKESPIVGNHTCVVSMMMK